MSYSWTREEGHRASRRASAKAGRPASRTPRPDHAGRIGYEIRRSLARDLHDRVAQTLTTMIVEVENHKYEHANMPRVVSRMGAIQDSARDVLSNLRQLLYELRDEEGVGGCFVDALGSLLARYQQNTGIVTELTVRSDWPATLRTPAAANLRSLIEEALANVRRHSGAQSVSVVLESNSSDQLAVTVRDDGRGLEGDRDRAPGLGMTGMHERALLLGGRLSVAGVPGKGTTVRARFPRALLTATEWRPT